MISEKQLNQIFKSSSVPMMVLLPEVPDFSIVDVNEAYLALNGYKREQLVGKSFLGLAGFHDISDWATSLEKVVVHKKADKIPVSAYTVSVNSAGDKETRYWEIDHAPILDDDNEVAFILCSILDHTSDIITRKNSEQALTESLNQFYSLLQTIEGIVWEADADTLRFTFVSDHAKQILGFSTNEWLTEPHFWENHIHPGDRDEVLNYVNLKSGKEKSYSSEYRMIKADGSTIWIKDIVAITTDNNKRKWLRGLMLDITVPKRLSNLEYLEKNVLELNSKSNVTIQEILSYYLEGIEALFPQMKCSIMQVKGNRLHNWAAPSLSPHYLATIENLPVNDNTGSCGTAAFLKKKVIVSDIANDARWADYKQIASKYDLQACWSHPIINSEGEVLATLGLYYNKPKKPDEEELKVIERVTAILKVILENRQRAEIIADASVLMTQSQELAHFGNWRWDVQNNIVSWSDSLYLIYGLNKKDFKATFEGYQELLHPDDRERVYNIISNVLNSKQDVEFEERIIRPNGEMRYLKSWGKLKSDASGVPVEMIGACLDITESKKTQQELQSGESRLRALADSQTSYVIRIDLEGRYTYYNKKYLEDFGWILKDKDIPNTLATVTVQPYHHQLVRDILKKCIENPNKVYQVEFDKIQPNGSPKPTLWHFIGLANSNNQTTEVQCIGLDITDLKNAETALKISNERYEYVNKATNDAIFDWNIIEDAIKWGNGFFRMFGFDSKAEYTSYSWASQVHPEDKERILDSLLETLKDEMKDNWSVEYRFKKADGSYADVEGTGYIVRNETGKPIRMIGVIRDITERLNYIKAIEKQNEKLLEIAWMQSHVVRAPLTKIIGLADLIRDFPNNDDEENQLIEHLLTCAYELDDIIRNISAKTEQIDLNTGIALK
ncbi:PAS domain-containing protein [Mucilaginibacter xinganensis]|uniref:histidine kinase n=1 Tax=Mucilaginibacter xinganensis TaxID=1234841 RepID=A0A223NRD1_9SPHI|nr:PAS domain-containing protein [Mucilaginibacter xinganensis]ASU32031.1 hypothetical protein MuYL_0128 [Mucilaginibacter xinganensis]